MRFKFIVALSLTASLFADPFGKDAELVNCKKPKYDNTYKTLPEALIRFHQTVVSPADGPRSHFYPCSSQYTLNAMRKYGFYRGFLMGCDRLQRENDETWIYRTRTDSRGVEIKYDPTP